MHFPNTTAMMKDLQHSQGIRLEQVMQLIEKLFSDIQYQTGDLVEDCQIGNMNLLVPTLSAVTNDIVFIFRNHEKEITQAEHKYFGSLTNAQSACAKCMDQLNAARQALQSLEEEEVKLTQQRQEAELLQKDQALLEQRVQDLQTQIRKLTPSNDHSSAAQLQQTIVSLQTQLDALTAQFAQDQLTAAQLQKDIADKEAEIARISEEIRQKRTASSQLDTQLQELRTSEAQLDQSIADKQAKVRESIEQQKQKSAQLERIQAAIDQYAQTIAQMEAELTKLSEQEADKAREATHFQAQLEALKRRLESHAKLLADCQNEYRNTEARLKHDMETLQNVRDNISDTQKSIQNAEQELSSERTLAESLKAKLFAVNSDVEYQKRDNEIYRKEHLEPAEAQLAQVKAEIAASEQRNQEMKQTLADAKKERENILSQNNLLEQHVAQAQQKLAEQKTLFQANTDRLTVLETAVREKASAVTNLINRQNELHELLNGRDTEQIQKDLEAKNQQLTQDISTADELEAKIRELQAELKISQERLTQRQKELKDLREEEQTLQSQYDDVSAQLDQVNSEENRSRSAKIQNQLDILRGLAGKLSDGSTGICGDKFFLEQQVCVSLNQAEQTIQAIRHVICAYADQRQSALEARD